MRAKSVAGSGWVLLKRTGEEFLADDCMSSAAAIAYYAIFSMPPILVIVIRIGGWLGQGSRIGDELAAQVNQAAGPGAYEQLIAMSEKVATFGSSAGATAVGVGVLLFSATGVLAQLQYSLNRVWEVQPDPRYGGALNFIVKRALSLGMILAFAFLLLVSTLLSVMLTAFGNLVSHSLGLSLHVTDFVSLVVNLIVVTLLFAAMFKVLPDAKVGWRSLWLGSVVTAVLFIVGKRVVSLYISVGGIESTYGTLVAVLVWFYYSSLIVLVGAEFTQVWARRYGMRIEPEEGAVRVVQEQKPLLTEREQREHDEQAAATPSD